MDYRTVLIACVAFVALGAALLALALLPSRRVKTSEPASTRDIVEGLPATDGSVPAAVAEDPVLAAELPDVLIDPTVLIEKAARALTVLSAGTPVKRYRIALGSAPIGAKQRAGDGRTPEGSYIVCAKEAAGPHGPSLGLSYPAEQDAERGLAEHLITAREHRAIVSAARHMERPPWRTGLGGEMLMCGGGTSTDWTDGSIALDDADVAALFAALPLGTPVEIRP